jgi:hypothetical protein
MKTLHARSLAIFICNVLFITSIATGQSVTIGTIPESQFCAGDPLSVTFTVTGTWGHNNAFTLQLSNDSGTFDNGFTRLGSVIDTAPGSFTINTSIPPPTPYSSHYRVRVIGAYPYTVSADNGSDILIGEQPTHVTWKPGVLESSVAVGVPIEFRMFDFSTSDDTEHVDFGAGATQSSAGVTYNSSGLKKIVIESVAPGGCSVMDSFQVYAFGCENPVIPHDAIILSSNTVFTDNNQSNKTFWLNPGVSLTLGVNESDTIFVEAGSSVSGQNGGQTDDIVYLKTGASSDPDFYGVVVYQPGSSLTNTNGASIRTVECPDLMFDYSVAPPNSVMHINEAVTPAGPLPPIAVSPNPTNGVVAVQGVPVSAQVQVMNVLGVAVKEMARTTESNFNLDLSKLVPGTYYIRFSSANSVVTKKIIKN